MTALGGVEFSPNDFFSPNSQQRWTGLIFGNAEHTAVGLPHLTGEKWQLVDPEVMISQKCASCNYVRWWMVSRCTRCPSR